MRRTRYVALPVRAWQYVGLLVVSLACLTLGLVSRDKEGHAGSLAGPELEHRAPRDVDACPNLSPFTKTPACWIDDRTTPVTRVSRSRSLDRVSGARQLLGRQISSRTDSRSAERSARRRMSTMNDLSRRVRDLDSRLGTRSQERTQSRRSSDPSARLSPFITLDEARSLDRRSRNTERRLVDRRENPDSARRMNERPQRSSRLDDRLLLRDRIQRREVVNALERRENRERRTNDRRENRFDMERREDDRVSNERREIIAHRMDRRLDNRRNRVTRTYDLRNNPLNIEENRRRVRSVSRDTSSRYPRDLGRRSVDVRDTSRDSDRDSPSSRSREPSRISHLANRTLSRRSSARSIEMLLSADSRRERQDRLQRSLRLTARRDSSDRRNLGRLEPPETRTERRERLNTFDRRLDDRFVRSLERSRIKVEARTIRTSESLERDSEERRGRSLPRSARTEESSKREEQRTRGLSRLVRLAEVSKRDLVQRRERTVSNDRRNKERRVVLVRSTRSSDGTTYEPLNGEKIRADRRLVEQRFDRRDLDSRRLQRVANDLRSSSRDERLVERIRSAKRSRTVHLELSRLSDKDSRYRSAERNLPDFPSFSRNSDIAFRTKGLNVAGFQKEDSIARHASSFEILRQALLVGLCTMYGLSLFQGKRSFFGNVITHRFFVW